MATIYGAEIGIRPDHIDRDVIDGAVCGSSICNAFSAGYPKRSGPRTRFTWHYVFIPSSPLPDISWNTNGSSGRLGFGVATVQGGAQALSRSFIGRMMPKSKSAEFYGFFSVFEKFATILGPALFGVVSQITGHSRLSIVSLIIFFLLGLYILTRVNVDEGVRVAIADENELQSA